MLTYLYQSILTAGKPRSKENLLSRSKRNLDNFHDAIKCYNKDVNAAASYFDYGCFCGMGGASTPVDETDRWEIYCVLPSV